MAKHYKRQRGRSGNVEVDYQPLPAQSSFHSSPSKFKWYAGGFGSGKTLCGCAEAIKLSLETSNNLGLIGRLTFPELRDTTMRTFFGLCPPALIKNWRRTEGILELTNGSEILFRHLDNPEQFRSLELGFFYLDEGHEVGEETFLILAGRLRRKVPDIKYHGFITSNCEGHNWLWKKFVAEKRNDYFHIVASTYQNPYLPPDYIPTLEEAYPKDWVKRYLNASFDVFEGQIYPEFDINIHVIDQFRPPSAWRKFRSIDHGLRSPTCCLFACSDPDGRIFIYDEYYEANKTVAENCYAIRARSGNFEFTVIDPATAQRSPVDKTCLADEYAKYGVITVPGNNKVSNGILAVKSRFLRQGVPGLYITRNCTNLISEIASYRWQDFSYTGESSGKKGDYKEKPHKANDHACDALRYLIMMWYDKIEKQETEFMSPQKADYIKAIEARRGIKGVHPYLGSEA